MRVDTLPLLVLFYKPQKACLWSLLPQFESSPHSASLSTGAAVRCQAEIKKRKRKKNRARRSILKSFLSSTQTGVWPEKISRQFILLVACRHTFFIASSLWKLRQTLCSLSGLSKHSCRASKIQTDNQARGSIEGFFVVVSLRSIRRIQRDGGESVYWCFHFLFALSPSCHYKQSNWCESKLTSTRT